MDPSSTVTCLYPPIGGHAAKSMPTKSSNPQKALVSKHVNNIRKVLCGTKSNKEYSCRVRVRVRLQLLNQLSLEFKSKGGNCYSFSTSCPPSISPSTSASENTVELRHDAIIETMISAADGCNRYKSCAVLHAVVLLLKLKSSFHKDYVVQIQQLYDVMLTSLKNYICCSTATGLPRNSYSSFEQFT